MSSYTLLKRRIRDCIISPRVMFKGNSKNQAFSKIIRYYQAIGKSTQAKKRTK